MFLRAKEVCVPDDLDSSIIIYKCKDIKQGACKINLPYDFDVVVHEKDGKFKRIIKLEGDGSDSIETKDPKGIWFVRTSLTFMLWGTGNMSCEKDGQRIEFGANGELSFFVKNADDLVQQFLKSAAVNTKDIRKHLSTKMYGTISGILSDYVSKSGLKNLDKTACQNEITEQLIHLFLSLGLSLGSFTIEKSIDYSELEV